MKYYALLSLVWERLQNQRPTLVVPPDVSTSVKEIWIGNVLLLETFLLKFLPAPEPFRRKDVLGLHRSGFKSWNLKAFGGFKSWNLKAFGGVKYQDLKAFVENPAGD